MFAFLGGCCITRPKDSKSKAQKPQKKYINIFKPGQILIKETSPSIEKNET